MSKSVHVQNTLRFRLNSMFFLSEAPWIKDDSVSGCQPFQALHRGASSYVILGFLLISLSLSSPLILGSICQSAGLQSRVGQWEERGIKGNRVQAKADKPQTKQSIEWRDAFKVAFSHHRPLNFTSSSIFYEMLLLRKIKIKAKSWRCWGSRRAGWVPDLHPGGSGLTCGCYYGWNLDDIPLPIQGWERLNEKFPGVGVI